MQSCLALRFLVKRENGGARARIFIMSFQNACGRLGRQTSARTDFCSSKNNFRGHDISQGLDREPPSLSLHFLLPAPMAPITFYMPGTTMRKGSGPGVVEGRRDFHLPVRNCDVFLRKYKREDWSV